MAAFTVGQLASHWLHHQYQQQNMLRVHRDMLAKQRMGQAVPPGWPEHIRTGLVTVAATISTIGRAMAQVPAANDD